MNAALLLAASSRSTRFAACSALISYTTIRQHGRYPRSMCRHKLPHHPVHTLVRASHVVLPPCARCLPFPISPAVTCHILNCPHVGVWHLTSFCHPAQGASPFSSSPAGTCHILNTSSFQEPIVHHEQIQSECGIIHVCDVAIYDVLHGT